MPLKIAPLAKLAYSDWPNDLVPAEVAELFRVDPKTVTRWAQSGRIPSHRTLGGHRRFKKEDVYFQYTGRRASEMPRGRESGDNSPAFTGASTSYAGPLAGPVEPSPQVAENMEAREIQASGVSPLPGALSVEDR